jgi:hypothetical protein
MSVPEADVPLSARTGRRLELPKGEADLTRLAQTAHSPPTRITKSVVDQVRRRSENLAMAGCLKADAPGLAVFACGHARGPASRQGAIRVNLAASAGACRGSTKGADQILKNPHSLASCAVPAPQGSPRRARRRSPYAGLPYSRSQPAVRCDVPARSQVPCAPEPGFSCRGTVAAVLSEGTPRERGVLFVSACIRSFRARGAALPWRLQVLLALPLPLAT